MLHILLLRGAAIVIGSLVYIRIGQQQEFGGRAAGDILENPVKGADVIEAAGQGNVGNLIFGVPKLRRGLFHPDQIQIRYKIDTHELFKGLGKMTVAEIHPGSGVFQGDVVCIVLVIPPGYGNGGHPADVPFHSGDDSVSAAPRRSGGKN